MPGPAARIRLLVALLILSDSVPLSAHAQRLDVRFLVDDEVLIHELCTRGQMAAADPALSRAVVEAQSRIWSLPGMTYDFLGGSWVPGILESSSASRLTTGARELLDRVKATAEYRLVHEQSMDRLAQCAQRWTADRDRSERLVTGLTGITFTGSYRVLVLHPAMASAQNMGHHVIKWGGHTDWAHSTTSNVWHEVLHDHLPGDDLGHVLVQLVADHELRLHFDPAASDTHYHGHAHLKPLTALVLPFWSQYKARKSRRITDLYAELERLNLPGTREPHAAPCKEPSPAGSPAAGMR